MHECLAQLVTENLEVTRWLLKLDDQVDGRGIAYIDIAEHLRCYPWALKEAQRYGEKWSKKWAQVNHWSLMRLKALLCITKLLFSHLISILSLNLSTMVCRKTVSTRACHSGGVCPQIQGWQCGAYVGAVEGMMCVWVLQRRHSGDECDLASNLCTYDLRKGDLFVLSWARVLWVRRGCISSELLLCGRVVRSILLLPLVAWCLETIDVCIWSSLFLCLL